MYFFQVIFFSVYLPRSGIAGIHGSSIFSFFKESPSILFSIVGVPIYIPTNSAWGFHFLDTLSSICCLWIFFDDSYFDWCEVISHCSFDLYFSSNFDFLKEINSEYSLEKLMLKLKLQNFGYLMRIANSLEKTLFLGTIEGRGRRGRQRMSWLANITDSMDMSLSKLWEMVDQRAACCATVHGVIKSQTRLSNWTTATTMYFHFYVT